MQGIDLADDCELIEDHDHLVVFRKDGQTLAALHVDENEDALPGADPNEHGWLIAQINFMDTSVQPGLAIVEVMRLEELVVRHDLDLEIMEG